LLNNNKPTNEFFSEEILPEKTQTQIPQLQVDIKQNPEVFEEPYTEEYYAQEPEGPSAIQIAQKKASKRKVNGIVSSSGNGLPSMMQSGEFVHGSKDELKTTSAASVKQSRIGDPNKLIAQGKIINAILETAINTDLPGTLRAVVSHDVFAESGNNILVPKGSRLIGNYADTIEKGQIRLAIQWRRIILPGGTDVVINADGTDQLGRSGVEGVVDNNFWKFNFIKCSHYRWSFST
jgi:type IV secretion system protein VirB10